MLSKRCNIHRIIKRSYVTNHSTSKEVRQTFLDYFIKKNDHKFIRSSPVVPYCDPTIAFVNAGMNQFKNVFLGNKSPPSSRAANSQKCVRVGGKHNDLTVVGTDSYHHTFFEMLGNWSFSDYFKPEACQMAWNLITKEYRISPDRLYVTYFAGDKTIGLPADLECKEIWRQLGVADDRILPFGMKENFWEMGSTGPCGPCTEIHIDHVRDSMNRSKLVNVDGQSDVTELWNLVFIEYNRQDDGTVTKLPNKHIDTGMGMERLTAVVQNKRSNYDTDLFLPLFDHMEKISKAPAYKGSFSGESLQMDTAYRILADHSRMIVACLSDGMLPDQNHKLRRVMRKAILVAENNFKTKHLLNEVVPKVVDSLGDSYPEMQVRLPHTLSILQYEHELFDALRSSSSEDISKILKSNPKFEEIDLVSTPGLIYAYNDLMEVKETLKDGVLPGKIMFKLYDTYGINEALIEKIAELEGLTLDVPGFNDSLQAAKQRTKSLFSMSSDDNAMKGQITSSADVTECVAKYNFKFDGIRNMYIVKPVQAKVLAITNGKIMLKSIESYDDSHNYSIIVDKSNFYCESGGQIGDMGRIVGNKDVVFRVSEVSDCSGRLLHSGRIEASNGGSIQVGDTVHVFVDNDRRTGATLNHTATHIINSSIRQATKSVVYQKSSHVSPELLKFEVGIVGKKLNRETIARIEAISREVVGNFSAVHTDIIDISKLYESDEIVLVPGEVYPESGLRLLTIKNGDLQFSSSELCCGTHAANTAELCDICIVNVKQSGRGSYLFTAMAGPSAKDVHSTGRQMMTDVATIQADLLSGKQKLNDLEARVTRMKHLFSCNNVVIPYVVKLDCLDILNNISKQIKDVAKESLRSFIESEMKTVLEQCPHDTHPFIVHFLTSGFLLESISLQKATRLCTDRPILVMSLTEGMVKARCCVPKEFAISGFRADEWVSTVANVFRAQIAPPKGMNPDEVCNMKAKKMQSSIFEERLELALDEAKKFAETFFKFENLSKRSHK